MCRWAPLVFKHRKAPSKAECDDRFRTVAEEFARNFAERGEVGASVCVTLDGQTVVDLWGGVANVETNAPWERDTVCTVFSCTKGATAICAHILVSRGPARHRRAGRGVLARVRAERQGTRTVHMMLDHSVGVPSWREP